jgi:hypothetical protein
VQAKELTPQWKLYSKPIAVTEPPESLLLRVFAEGGARVEVRKARLVERSLQVISGFPVTRGPLQEKLAINGDVAELGASGWAAGRLLHAGAVRSRCASTQRPRSPVARGPSISVSTLSGMPLDDFQRRHLEPHELAASLALKRRRS